MKIGLLGLPLSGKSTLFGLLTGITDKSGKPEARIGMADIPDNRLDHLHKIYKPRKKVPAKIEFVDIPGLVPGEEKKSNPFLDEVRKVELLVYVLRSFSSDNTPHVEGDVDPDRDWELLELELLLADLDLFEKRIKRIHEEKKKPKGWENEVRLLEKCRDALGEGISMRHLELTDTEQELLQGYSLLTEKPVLVVVNTDEEQYKNNAYPKKEAIQAKASAGNIDFMEISAQIEMEIAQLEPEDRTVFLEDLSLQETGIQRLARLAYHTLGLISFFTVGDDEVRAWTIKAGTNAKTAAGKIHSDIERGFIRAEVLAYDDLLRAGSVARSREMGLYRLEGKEYIMQDGDITNFRFNV